MCYLLALVTVANPSVLQQQAAWGQSQARPAKKDAKGAGDLEASKRSIEALERTFLEMERVKPQIPRVTFDPAAIVQQVGKDPAALFEWVRDKTFWIGYRGALRGAQGVLMDRLGNSLDRSLLLCALLRAAGHDARLAHGSLTLEQAGALLSKIRPVPRNRMPQAEARAPGAAEEALAEFARRTGIDLGTLRGRRQRDMIAYNRSTEAIVRRVDQQTTALSQALGKSAGKAADASADALAALRDHWWVQRHDGAQWQDLDPLLAASKSGEALIAACQTLTADPQSGLFHLDREAYQETELRLVIEKWDGSQFREQEMLRETIRPAELVAGWVSLMHAPTTWPQNFGRGGALPSAPEFEALLARPAEWLPILVVGSRRIMKKSFTDSGDVNDTPTAPILGSAAQTVGREIGGILGGHRIGGGNQKPSVLTGEWLEYVIHIPGKSPRVVRRQVFDLVGPAARASKLPPAQPPSEAMRINRALALLGESEILVLGAQPSPEFVINEGYETILANRASLLGLLRQPPNNLKPIADALASARRIPALGFRLALARQFWSPVRGDVFLDSPNIFAYHRVVQRLGPGTFDRRIGYDIVENHVAVRSGSDAVPFLVRLRQGIVDTNCEAILMGASGKVENTSELFDISLAREVPWSTVRQPGDLPPDDRIGKDVRARLAADLAAGAVVVAPEHKLSLSGREAIGWWRIDAQTGDTLGVGENGDGEGVEGSLVLAGFTVALILFTSCIIRKTSPMNGPIDANDPQQQQELRDRGECLLGLGIHLLTAVVSGMLGWVDGLIEGGVPGPVMAPVGLGTETGAGFGAEWGVGKLSGEGGPGGDQ